jgi:hypothetical protein
MTMKGGTLLREEGVMTHLVASSILLPSRHMPLILHGNSSRKFAQHASSHRYGCRLAAAIGASVYAVPTRDRGSR